MTTSPRNSSLPLLNHTWFVSLTMPAPKSYSMTPARPRTCRSGAPLICSNCAGEPSTRAPAIWPLTNEALALLDLRSASTVRMCTACSKVQWLLSERKSRARAEPDSIDIGPCVTRTWPDNSSVSLRKSEFSTSALHAKAPPMRGFVNSADAAGRATSSASASAPATAKGCATRCDALLQRFVAAMRGLHVDLLTVQIGDKALHGHDVRSEPHVHGRARAVCDVLFGVDSEGVDAQEGGRSRIRGVQLHVAVELHRA